MTNHNFDEKEKNFNLNVLRLRDRVFGLRYTDVSAISALSQSTLSAYAPVSNSVKGTTVSPTLTIGKKNCRHVLHDDRGAYGMQDLRRLGKINLPFGQVHKTRRRCQRNGNAHRNSR